MYTQSSIHTGCFIMAIACITGILLLAVPISVISANFQTEFLRMKISKDIKKSTYRLGIPTRPHPAHSKIKGIT